MDSRALWKRGGRAVEEVAEGQHVGDDGETGAGGRRGAGCDAMRLVEDGMVVSTGHTT